MAGIGQIIWTLLRRGPSRQRFRLSHLSALFDPDYYRNTYPDVPRGVNPLLHFIVAGGFEGRNPHPLFDTAFYTTTYPDAAASWIPLLHYLRYGSSGDRRPHPLFDAAFYLQSNPDVRAAGVNPLLHYVLRGAAEGRKPHPLFQPDYYLQNCPEARLSRSSPPWSTFSNALGTGLIHIRCSTARIICSTAPTRRFRASIRWCTM
jgi:hypothetical protein